MRWRCEGAARVTVLPEAWGGGEATAWRDDGQWRIDAPGLSTGIHHPRLRTWTRARGVVEATLRAHYEGPTRFHHTPRWENG